MTGSFFITEHNEKYCGHHEDPRRCRNCLRVLKAGEIGPCQPCQSFGYYSSKDAANSITRVSDWMESLLGVHSLRQIPVSLTDGLDFGPSQSGVTNWRYDGQSLDIQIDVLRPAQPHVFEPTLAHEYGHVLLIADPVNLDFTGGIGESRLLEEEGFCEVLRYLWVEENATNLRDVTLRAIRDNPDVIYGNGFRLMWPRYKACGSVFQLRNEMLGIDTSTQTNPDVRSIWKRRPSSSVDDGEIQEDLAQEDVQHRSTPPHQVIEGGSHRPILDLGLNTSLTTPPIDNSSSNSDTTRPTIDLDQAIVPSSNPQGSRPPTPKRPIIRLD